MILLLGIALISGILMGLTPAPVGAWFLAWIALAPLWLIVVSYPKQKSALFPVSFFLFPLLWGIGYHGLAASWIMGIHPMTWMGVPWLASLAIAIFCLTFITLWGAALVIVWAVGMRVILGAIPNPKSQIIMALIRVLIGVALWCGLESLWSSGALWWTSISYTQSPHNLAILHLGQISGPSTVTAAIVAVNGILAEAFQLTNKKGTGEEISIYAFNWHYLSIAAGLFFSLHLLGLVLYSQPLIDATATALKVGIIQGNIPNTIKLFADGKRRALENYTAGYQALADQGVEAVLTPEVALPFFIPELRSTSFFSAILEKGVVAWVGAYGEQGYNYTNSLFTITGKGENFSRYNKVKLVPLGEYIPFQEVLGKVVSRLSPLKADMTAGASNQIFNTPFGQAIVGICYESAFAEHFRRQTAAGGQFMLTASNNSHYSPSMPAQHHAQDVMRAIENDRWAVRATNTGYSGIVDPHGRTLWISGINTYEIHAETIYRRETQTLYVRWGDWLTPMLLGLGAIGWLFLIRFKRF